MGFDLQIPLSTYEALGEPGSQVSLYTHLHVREDGLSLYAFATLQEREVFRLPQAVRVAAADGRREARTGRCESIEINRPSGHKVLDQAAIRIVRMSAPFDRFPDAIRKDSDILYITRTWTFTRSDQISAE